MRPRACATGCRRIQRCRWAPAACLWGAPPPANSPPLLPPTWRRHHLRADCLWAGAGRGAAGRLRGRGTGARRRRGVQCRAGPTRSSPPPPHSSSLLQLASPLPPFPRSSSHPSSPASAAWRPLWSRSRRRRGSGCAARERGGQGPRTAGLRQLHGGAVARPASDPRTSAGPRQCSKRAPLPRLRAASPRSRDAGAPSAA